jgi:hypothetical protein
VFYTVLLPCYFYTNPVPVYSSNNLASKTPLEWYSKKQPTVETATYGSEIIAARTCVEQIIDLRNTLQYHGVPFQEKCYMFGDNKSAVDSSMQVNAKLHNRHTILSFHRVQERIAAKMVDFYFIPGESNPAGILSSRLKTLLLWMGDTNDIEDKRYLISNEWGVTRFALVVYMF